MSMPYLESNWNFVLNIQCTMNSVIFFCFVFISFFAFRILCRWTFSLYIRLPFYWFWLNWHRNECNNKIIDINLFSRCTKNVPWKCDTFSASQQKTKNLMKNAIWTCDTILMTIYDLLLYNCSIFCCCSTFDFSHFGRTILMTFVMCSVYFLFIVFRE